MYACLADRPDEQNTPQRPYAEYIVSHWRDVQYRHRSIHTWPGHDSVGPATCERARLRSRGWQWQQVRAPGTGPAGAGRNYRALLPLSPYE
jgi:hypothetical protein